MDELKNKIEQALNSLDPENNGHWTKEGLPAVPFLSILVGGGVTRELVDEVGNGLTRELAKERAAQKAAATPTEQPTTQEKPTGAEADAGAGEPSKGQEGQSQDAPVAEAKTVFVFRADGDVPAFDVGAISSSGDQSIHDHLLEVRAVQDKINMSLANLTELRLKVQEYADKVVTAIEEDRKVRPGADATTMYLQSRQKQLAHKAAELAEFREKGIGELMKMVPRPSPLDQALARKR